MTTDRDPYAILGVPSDASQDEIAAARRALARRFHPDVSPLPDAERRMAEINAAWTTLGDPARRRAWDVAHGIPGATRRPANGHNGHDRQNGSAPADHPPGTVGREWTMPQRPSGTPTWRRGPNGEGAAGPPPGRPSGSVLSFGRHIGWSLGEILRVDRGYLQWLVDRPEGAPYRDEIRALLNASRPGSSPDTAFVRRDGRRRPSG